uniref:Ig-like domain-containing protein n=1 Tax=Seriola lalandi dorsalis TaxID=1841481 RepID=A0A3B4YU85_SERLL
MHCSKTFISYIIITYSWVPHHISLTVVEPGDNLTLTCKVIGKEIGLFYWYKLNFGYMIQIIASGSFTKITLQGQFKNPRFNVRKVGDLHSLIIRNISKEDEATYFCQAGAAYLMKFINGTNLAVNGKTASVQLGASMTLQCSLLYTNKESRAQCPGEHSVHWFRAGSGGFHPGIIYTHSNRSDEQEERSCVYSLSKTIQNSSDAGTYYCAVVTCGEILFGEGTKVETTSLKHSVTKYQSRRNATNYVALAFSKRRGKREKKKIESPEECVYSAVKTEYHTSH